MSATQGFYPGVIEDNDLKDEAQMTDPRIFWLATTPTQRARRLKKPQAPSTGFPQVANP